MYVCTLHASTHMCSKRVRLLEKESKGREGGEAEEMTEVMYSVQRCNVACRTIYGYMPTLYGKINVINSLAGTGTQAGGQLPQAPQSEKRRADVSLFVDFDSSYPSPLPFCSRLLVHSPHFRPALVSARAEVALFLAITRVM